MAELPKFYETFIPILSVLKDGRIVHYSELLKAVKDLYYGYLTSEQLNLSTKDGMPVILNRIEWGKVYLKQAGMISQPSRAMVQITKKGLEMLGKGKLDLSDIKKDPDFILHRLKTKIPANLAVDIEESTPQDLIESGIQSIEEQTKAELLDRLKISNSYYFEHIVLELFNKMGYGKFLETPKSGDGGIDGIINQDELGLEKIYVQSKRYGDIKVRETDIRNFIGAMSGDTTKGIFVTTSSFDDRAKKKAHDARHNIILIDGLQLVDLMYKFSIGLQVKNSYVIKEIDEDYFY